MRSDIATITAFGLSVFSLATAQTVPPTFSCFDPPEEGQTNPHEDDNDGLIVIVGEACCAALTVQGDLENDRLVVWDPVNCNFGPGDEPIAEAPLCRAHDTDGCRFCYDSCEGFADDEICITCDELFVTSSPTGSPTDFLTAAPFGIFPETPSPVAPTDAPVAPTPSPVVPTDAPVVPETATPTIAPTEEPVDEPSDCECVNTMSAEEAAVLARRNKAMVCDETCVNGLDTIWGVMNCNYFALGQTCRACSNICTDMGDGSWLDADGFPCKPCSEI